VYTNSNFVFKIRGDKFLTNRRKLIFLKPLLLALCAVGALRADIDYRGVTSTDLEVTSFDFGGVTVTGGAGLVFVNVSNGLSIIGGNDSAVDPGEYLTFTFDAGPENFISVDFNSVLSSTATLQAFGPGSLGSQSVTVDEGVSPLDVSGLFGDQPITSFTLTDVTEGFRLDILDFTPEPSPVALVVTGLGALFVLRRRRSAAKMPAQ
jgi:hypothetical protein